MSLDQQHGLWAVKLGSTIIGGIEQAAVNTGSEVRAEAKSGEPYPRFASLVAQKPGGAFTTCHVAAALGAVGLLGVPLTSSDTLIFYAQKRLEGGTRASGSVHTSYTMRKGIVVPTRLSCDHQGDAMLEYRVIAITDGTNAPVTKADNVALPAGLTDGQRFSLGPITIGGVSIVGVQRLDIDFGVQAAGEGADSDVWDSVSSIDVIGAKITLSGKKISWMDNSSGIPLLGKAGTHANTRIYLRKREHGGTFVANGTAEHVSLTAAGMAVCPELFSAQGNQRSTTSIEFTCTFDGSNLPIVVNNATAIT